MSLATFKKKNPDDGKPKVPGWIVSFSDMITLLLAFFVLLQSFAKRDRSPLHRIFKL